MRQIRLAFDTVNKCRRLPVMMEVFLGEAGSILLVGDTIYYRGPPQGTAHDCTRSRDVYESVRGKHLLIRPDEILYVFLGKL